VGFTNASDEVQAFDAPLTSQTSGPSGTVPATLSLTLGPAAAFGPFTPGVAKDYFASTPANVISTAGDATLSVADPSATATGRLVNGSFALVQPLQVKGASPAGAGGDYAAVGGSSSPTSILTYSGPVSNDPVAIGFQAVDRGQRAAPYGQLQQGADLHAVHDDAVAELGDRRPPIPSHLSSRAGAWIPRTGS
jgi:hypothetical protein